MLQNIFLVALFGLAAILGTSAEAVVSRPSPTPNFTATVYANFSMSPITQTYRIFYSGESELLRIDQLSPSGKVQYAQITYQFANFTYFVYPDSCSGTDNLPPWLNIWNFVASSYYTGIGYWNDQKCASWETTDQNFGRVVSCWINNRPVYVTIQSLITFDFREYKGTVKDSDFDLPDRC